jgi:tetratricopeptide (TPR) repeat protein
MTDIELDVESALISFGRALERDSTYAKAYAGTARAYYMLAWSHVIEPEMVWPGMQYAIERAVVFDDGSSDVRISVALFRAFHDYDWTAAETELRNALRINPSKVEAHSDFSLLLSILGRHDDAVEQARAALRLTPDDSFERWQLGFSFLWSERYAEAMQLTQDLLFEQPDFGLAHYLLSNIYCAQERYDDAIAAMRETMRLFREDELADEYGQMGYYFARSGQADSARAQLEALDQLSVGGRYVSPLAQAIVYVGLGNYDRAFDLLEEALRRRDGWMPYIRVWKTSFLSPIESDPRLVDLLRRMNLPD